MRRYPMQALATVNHRLYLYAVLGSYAWGLILGSLLTWAVLR